MAAIENSLYLFELHSTKSRWIVSRHELCGPFDFVHWSTQPPSVLQICLIPFACRVHIIAASAWTANIYSDIDRHTIGRLAAPCLLVHGLLVHSQTAGLRWIDCALDVITKPLVSRQFIGIRPNDQTGHSFESWLPIKNRSDLMNETASPKQSSWAKFQFWQLQNACEGQVLPTNAIER